MATEVTAVVDPDAGAGYHYTSLKAAIAGELSGSPVAVTSSDLVTNDEQLTIECRCTGGSDDSSLIMTLDTFTVDSDNFVKIHIPETYRHLGVPVSTGNIYRNRGAGGGSLMISVQIQYVQIIGLLLIDTGGGSSKGMQFHPSLGINGYIDSFCFDGNGDSYGLSASNASIVTKNSFIRNTTNGFNDVGLTVNCTARDCNNGFVGHFTRRGYLKNCLSINSTTADYSNSFNTSSDYNAASDTTAPGTNSVNSASVTFESSTSCIITSASTDIIDAGIGPASDSDVPTLDIIGNTRSGTTCDIGASEYVSSGAVIAGAHTITATSAATMAFNQHPAITGAHTITATSAAAMQYASGYTITGAHTITATSAAAMQYASGYTITGAHTITATSAATMAFNQHPAITGAHTITATSAAAMQYASGYTITGAHTITATSAATMAFNQHPAITGAHTITATSAAAMQYASGAGIIGAHIITATSAAAMVFNQHPAIVGAITLLVTGSATMIKTGEGVVHRIEAIMSAIKTRLDALPAGVPVYRARGATIPDGADIIYRLRQGASDPLDDTESTAQREYIDLNWVVQVVARDADPETLETTLNDQVEIIYNDIMQTAAIRQLGLNFVFNTFCDGTGEILDDPNEGKKPTASIDILFRTRYKQPINSASV